MIQILLNGGILSWQMVAEVVGEAVVKEEAEGVEVKIWLLVEEVEAEVCLHRMRGLIREDHTLLMRWTMRTSLLTTQLRVSV
jgi:hypothetical protein